MSPGLLQLAGLFLRLGFTAFGGPAAHIAMMREELVRRRRWVEEETFLDLLGVTNLIPGPNSTELAIHLGYRLGGWPGLVLAGACFILPAALIVSGLAWSYARYGSLPQTQRLLYFVKPVIIMIVVQAIFGLLRGAVRTGLLATLGLAVALLSVLGVDELLLLIGAGVLATLARGRQPGLGRLLLGAGLLVSLPGLLQPLVVGAGPVPFSLRALFWFFLKIGSVLYGSGYVLLAFLRQGLVLQWHWLSESQLLDAVAVGQVTPGPVFTTATFIGFLLGGWPGAVLATLGIFLPSFVFVAATGKLVERLRSSTLMGPFLDGVNVGALALMAVVTVQLGQAALVDLPTLAMALASGILLLRLKVSSAWVILGAAGLSFLGGLGNPA